jgi:type III secretory pathway lipoprotein EscJ
MSEREEEALSVVALTWSDDINMEKTDDHSGLKTVVVIFHY